MLELSMKLAGVLFTIAVSVAILTMVFFYVKEKAEEAAERKHRRARELAWRDIGHRLINDSYWFSGNKEAFKVLYMLGWELCHHGGYDINNFRQKVADTDTETFTP